MNNTKRWFIGTMAITLVLLVGLGSVTAVIDPFFHYHKPLEQFEYRIIKDRYANNGIVKNFDYDAIITGTSMTQNFKTSQLDELFGVHSIKVPYSGASYKEVNDNLKVAFANNDNIRMVVRSLDTDRLITDKDYMEYTGYPTYLYDDKLCNDVNYVLNKSILFDSTITDVVKYTSNGNKTTTFDEYGNWMDTFESGKEHVLDSYNRGEKSDVEYELTDEDKKILQDNLEQNVLELVREHPETEFYLFFPPYSIAKWDEWYRAGILKKQLDAEKYAIELLVPYKNVHLFSFSTEFDITTDFNSYKDVLHYASYVNEFILSCMSDDKYRLSEDNYSDYYNKMCSFYLNFEYEGLR